MSKIVIYVKTAVLMPEFNREDILTPANAVSLAGFALTAYGATHIGDVSGVLEAGAGRVLDLADGFIARKTHASEFGAKLDATLDKMAVGVIAGEAWYQHAAPEAVIGVIALYNVVNAVSNVYSVKKTGQANTSIAGKRAMFGQNIAAGMLLLGHSLNVSNLDIAGWTAFGASMPIASKATYDYVNHARKAYSKNKLPKQPKNHARQRR